MPALQSKIMPQSRNFEKKSWVTYLDSKKLDISSNTLKITSMSKQFLVKLVAYYKTALKQITG